MDTMKATKIVGGVCGSLLVFLLIKWGAEIIFHPGGGHGEEGVQAYAIAVPESGEAAGGEEAAPEVPFEEFYAVADADAGSSVFRKCQSCHKVGEGENGTGPTLFGIVGRAVAGEAGFANYSGGMAALGGEWTPERLNEFLIRPSDYVPGTGMRFSGLGKPEDRANLIAYLATLN